MSKILLFAIVLAYSLLCIANAANPYRALGTFPVSYPSFLALLKTNKTTGPDLFITSFQGFGKGSIYYVPDVGSKIRNASAIKVQTAASDLNWPNEIYLAPPNTWNVTTIVWGDGFLPPGKSDGNIYAMHFINGTFTKPIELANKKSGYFYHQVTFYDMNGDGLQDIVTARVNKPIIGSSKSELLWLECPKNISARDQVWQEHVILSGGPDVTFLLGDLDNDGSTLEVIAPKFFTGNTLNIYQFDKTTLALKSSAVIDNAMGPPYNCEIQDFNNNGQRQLMVTNHAGKQDETGIFLFDVPADLMHDKWTKHQIGSNFPISAAGLNQASPGYSYSTTFTTSGQGEYRSILVAGDGAERAYLMQRTADYQYTQEEIIKFNGVVGAMAIGDVDGDGYNDFFVPNYEREGSMTVFTFAP